MSGHTEGALKLLQDTAVKATAVDVIQPTCEPEHVYYTYQQQSDQLERRTAAPGPWGLFVTDIGSLVAAIAIAELCPAYAIVRDREVVAHDQKTQRDSCRLRLGYTAAFDWLCGATKNGGIGFKQADFLRHFDLVMAGAVAIDDINLFRKLEWKGSSKLSQDQTGGNESLGHDVHREVHCAGQPLPPALTVETPVYVGMGDPVKIKCGVFVDHEAKLLHVRPQGDAVELASLEAKRQVCKALADELSAKAIAGVEVLLG